MSDQETAAEEESKDPQETAAEEESKGLQEAESDSLADLQELEKLKQELMKEKRKRKTLEKLIIFRS